MDTQIVYNEHDVQSNNLYNLDFDDDKIELMHRTIARGASDDELALFVEQCRRTGLDPFARQIYSVRRKQWNSQSHSYEDAQVIQVSIDGFRLIADRTRKYAGQVGPWWCGPDGEWMEIWLSTTPPAAARVGVLRHDFNQPLYAVALYRSYVQTNSNGEPISRWKTDPAGMIAKCAEALALRRAFPNELSGLYATEEMEQADNPPNVTPSLISGVLEKSSVNATASTDAAASVDAGVVQPAARSSRKNGSRPYAPEELQNKFEKAVKAIEARGLVLGPDDYAITEAALNHLLHDPADLERYLLFVAGVNTLAEMSEAQVVALMRLLKPVSSDDDWMPGEDARSEAATVITRLDNDISE